MKALITNTYTLKVKEKLATDNKKNSQAVAQSSQRSAGKDTASYNNRNKTLKHKHVSVEHKRPQLNDENGVADTDFKKPRTRNSSSSRNTDRKSVV